MSAVFCYAQETVSAFPDEGGKLRLVKEKEKAVFSADSRNGVYSTSDVAGDAVTRRFYDSLFRLVREERWKTEKEGAKAVCTVSTVYTYDGENQVPFSSFADYVFDKKSDEKLYYADGRVKQQTLMHDDTDKDGQTVRTTDSMQTWKYDTTGRIIEHEITVYAPEKTVKKDVYDYSGHGNRPDHAYYENGEVRIRTVYSSVSAYTQTMYFDGGYSVAVDYKHGLKTKEHFILNGREMRLITYEKAE